MTTAGTTTATASTSARALARDHLTRSILSSARSQLGTVGAASLSVRAVARDVGLASSAVYRYFASRDDLLTALLVECFDEHGAAVEGAEAVVDRADLAGRWSAVAHAFRRWAVEHPWDYALLYGSPVPGYVAPQQTIGPATRVTRVLIGLLTDATGRAARPSAPAAGGTGPAFHTAVAGMRAFAGVDLTDDVVLAGLAAWSGLVGGVTLELFGHLENVVGDREVWFDALARRLDPFSAADAA
ncbi:MAG: TetR/AcrR family transcriptional regulator [Janthinobacterium lividum]